MDDRSRKQKTLKELVVESPLWDAEEMMHNLEEELERIEHGVGHMVWDDSNRPVTRCLRLLPLTPKFKVKESDERLSIEVELPNVSEDLVSIKVDKTGVEVSACTDDPVCRPYYVNIESRYILDPESTKLRHKGSTFEIAVEKSKKKRVYVKQTE